MYSQLIPTVVPEKQETDVEGPEGIRLSAVAWGNRNAPHHLLLVHGGYQAKETFREQYEALSLMGCYVVGFDLPWHGKTSLGGHHLLPTPDLFVESVEAVRNHFGLKARITLLAWSMGGLIAREYVQRNPLAIDGLILVAPLLDFAEGMAAGQRFRPEAGEVFAHLGREQEPFSGQAAALLAFVSMLEATEPDYLTFGYNARSFFSVAHLLEGILTSFAGGEVEAFLGSLSCPVLFIQGRQDMLVPPEYTRSNVDRIPAERVSLLEMPCGHSPHLELPLAFNAAVFEFLVSLSQGRTAPLMHSGGNEG